MCSSVREFTQGNETVFPLLRLTDEQSSARSIKKESDYSTVEDLSKESETQESGGVVLRVEEPDSIISNPAPAVVRLPRNLTYSHSNTGSTSPGLTQYPIYQNAFYPVMASISISFSALIPPAPGRSLRSAGLIPFKASFTGRQQTAGGLRVMLTTTIQGTAHVSSEVSVVPSDQA